MAAVSLKGFKKTSDDGSGTTGAGDKKVLEWCKELEDAFKREKDWRKEAKDAVNLYEGDKKVEYQFNILFSNTETLLPALYNNLPRPVAERRFKDDDPLGKVSCDVVKRTLSFLIDNEIGGDYTPFDDLITQATLEALVPGRGVTWFKYDATFVEREEPPEVEQAEDTTGTAPAENEPAEEVSYETVCGETVPWDRFRHGYAKQWKDVPWVAREHFFTREELVENFGSDIGNRVPCNISGKENGGDKEDGDKSLTRLDDADGAQFAQVFEIWDKATKRVYFVCPHWPDAFVKNVEDPLKLSGFFPMPRPLALFAGIKSLVPKTLYRFYEEQAKELNRITTRIQKIISALKVRGFYDSTLEGVDKLMDQEDNVLLPAENVAAMLQGQTLEKAIWLMPIEKLILVLQQLYAQRQQIKQVIYEVTGISDILRGASVASETATAQNLKSQWGTLRLRRSQRIVQKYVRNCLRIMAEIAVTQLSTKTIAGMTGLGFPTSEQKALAQQTLAQAQQAQATGGAPIPVTPAVQAAASMPSWDEIMALLRDDLQRNYHIDIETNSTVDADATEDKQDMGEFLNAVAQFLNGVAPLVQEGILPFDAAKSMLLAVVRRYAFGPEVEDQIKRMQPPKPQGGDGADGEAQAKAAAAQEAAKLDLQVKQAEAAARMRELEMEEQMSKAEHEAKMQELARNAQLAAAKFEAQMATYRAKAAAAATQPAPQASPATA